MCETHQMHVEAVARLRANTIAACLMYTRTITCELGFVYFSKFSHEVATASTATGNSISCVMSVTLLSLLQDCPPARTTSSLLIFWN